MYVRLARRATLGTQIAACVATWVNTKVEAGRGGPRFYPATTAADERGGCLIWKISAATSGGNGGARRSVGAEFGVVLRRKWDELVATGAKT